MEKNVATVVETSLILQGKISTKIHWLMEPMFRNFCPSFTSVKSWSEQFQCGLSSVADLPRFGKSASKCNEEYPTIVKTIIENDRKKMTILEMAELNLMKEQFL